MKIWQIFLISVTLILFGCSKHNQKILNNDLVIQKVQDQQLPPELYLSNRVHNCDSAIVYMTHIVTPISVYIYRYEWNEVTVETRILGESKSFFSIRSREQNSRRMLHFAPECLIGMKLEDVIRIFCNNEDQQRIRQYSEKRLNSFTNDAWYIHISVEGVNIILIEIKAEMVILSKFMEIPFPEE